MNEKEAINLLIKAGCSSSVIDHCKRVAEYAKEIAVKINENAVKRGNTADIDINAVMIGGLLHDIGRSKTHGIRHAVEGAAIAVENGLDEKLVKIIERHIGAGIFVFRISIDAARRFAHKVGDIHGGFVIQIAMGV